MLKFFSKVLFVSILSGSLLLLDFSYKGISLNNSRAESVKTDKISDQDLMGTLTMTVVGTIASRLYSYKMTTDVMLAAAGGAAFIAGEVLAYIKLKEVMKGMELEITRDKKGNINQEQIAALERLKKSYEEAKKTAETKKTLQMAAAAAFAAAGVAAYTMAAGDLTALTTCQTAIGTALTTLSTATTATCTALKAGTYTAALGALCAADVASCIPAITKLQASIMKYEMTRQATAPSGPALVTSTAEGKAIQAQLLGMNMFCKIMPYAGGPSDIMELACAPLIPTNDLASSGGAALLSPAGGNYLKNIPPIFRKHYLNNNLDNQKIAKILEQTPVQPKSFFDQALEMLMPKAHAALFSAMGIASSAAITYLLATSATLGPTIDMFLLIPQKRAIAWGVLAGLTFAATSATNNVIGQIESNISKIDAILNNLNSMAKGVKATQVASKTPGTNTIVKPGGAIILNATKYDDIDLGGGNNGTLPCFTGNDPKKCNSFEEGAKDLPSYKGLNNESQAQLNDILKTANAFNGTSKISGASLSSAGKLASNALAMKSAYDKARNKYAEDLKKAGSKFSLNDASNKLSKDIEKNVSDGLKKSKMSASDMMASMYGGRGGSGGGGAPGSAGETKTAGTDEKGPGLDVRGGGNVYDLSASGATAMDLGANGSGTTEEGQAMSEEELAAANAANSAANPLDQYDLKNDITSDKGASIFELISNRYQRSGYPRLFKVKEPAPAEPVKN